MTWQALLPARPGGPARSEGNRPGPCRGRRVRPSRAAKRRCSLWIRREPWRVVSPRATRTLLEGIRSPPLDSRLRSDEDVLLHVQRPEQLEPLERARHAEPGSTVRSETGYVPSTEHDPPSVRTPQAGEDVEKCGLSSSVRADQTRDRTGGHWNRHALKGLHSAEADRDLACLEQAGIIAVRTGVTCNRNRDRSVHDSSRHFRSRLLRRHRRRSRQVLV